MTLVCLMTSLINAHHFEVGNHFNFFSYVLVIFEQPLAQGFPLGLMFYLIVYYLLPHVKGSAKVKV